MAFGHATVDPDSVAPHRPAASPMRTQHPGVRAILGKLDRGETLSGEEVARLERRLLSPPRAADAPAAVEPEAAVAAARPRDLRPGHASAKGTARFAARHGTDTASFYRRAHKLAMSTVGIGTYRGNMDRRTDAGYAEAVQAALVGGINLVDTSLNYRHQRSERSVAAGIAGFLEHGGGHRDEIIVCTKGGFLVPGAVTPGTLAVNQVVGAMHSLAPSFLADQIERSRRNLSLETIDVYYLHNPETQLGFVDPIEFIERVRAAFEQLERAVSDGLIRNYGTATWNGYWEGALSLRALLAVAREVAGPDHHFRFIQMPFHLGMHDPPAPLADDGRLLEIAADGGVTVVASASLWQGRLVEDLPAEIAAALPGLTSDAQRAIHLARSTPGVAAALVGMRELAHVRENLAVAKVAPVPQGEYRRLVAFLS